MAEVAENALVDGRYRVRERIGSGGMADVYLADDTHLGREVALKVLYRRFAQDAEFVERFRREASAAAGLQHPNVVGIFDRGAHDDTYYIAMEHLGGRTLKELLNQDGPLDQERAIDIGIQVLQAARFAHRRGIIHRDLKPQNVIVDAADGAKVTDFGIARAGASEMTETGSIMGTAQYLSPEQAQGYPVSAASDIYSVGILLYELLAGHVPFTGDSAVSIALKQVNEAPVPLRQLRPDVHPALEAAVMRALAKEPASRYADADDFIGALEEARGAIASGDDGYGTAQFAALPAPVEEAWVEEPPVLEAEHRDRRRSTVLAVLLLLILAAAVAFALTRPEQVSVPDVLGQQRTEANAILERQGFEVEVRETFDEAPVNRVLDQDPNPRIEADKGSTVVLTVSKGLGQATVPPVEKRPRARAIRELKQAGFRVVVEERPSDEVPAGRAVETSPGAGETIDKGTRVRLVVSSGPEQVTIPQLVGVSRDSAETRLESLGLAVVVDDRPSDQREDQVIAQSPQPNTRVEKGARVTITVSTGPEEPEKQAVPGVVDLSEGDASAELRQAGFEVAVRERSVDSADDDGVVLEQRPPAGRELTAGRTVTIFVGRFEQEPDPPGDTTTPP